MGACNEPGCTDAVEGSKRCLEHRDLIDTEVFALGDPPRGEDDDDWREHDDEEDEYESALSDCHMGRPDGQCSLAGSEHCEFERPVMADWRREPWDENGPIHDASPPAGGET